MWSVLFIPFLLLPGGSQSTHSDLRCVNDYMNNLSCTWNSTEWMKGINCSINMSRETAFGVKSTNCSLNTTRSCEMNISPRFVFDEQLKVLVFCKGRQKDDLNFNPGRHVKLHPPDQLNYTGNNLTWSRGARFPPDIFTYVFEVQVKAKQQRWEEVKPRRVDGTFLPLEHVCKDSCEARVRVKPMEPTAEDQIRGSWSDWSSEVSWRSEVTRSTLGPHKPDTTHSQTLTFSHPAVIGALVGFSTLILILIILLSVYRHKCGLKCCGHVPDPSKYFQPLLIEHKGNFQKWLGPQHSASLFLPPQSCDCEISPVDEVSAVWDDPLVHAHYTVALHQQTSDGSQVSSGISNMGYFYSEHQPGSMCLDSCPVYFTYHPEGGVLQTSLSYERLRGTTPTSPDSGFGMEAEKEEADEEEPKDEEVKGQKMECSGVNMQHLVSFIISSPESRMTTVPPPSIAELTPWQEEPEASGIGVNAEPPEATVVRPSSMVVQPCSSGYLTLKEMQKYSNKSI